jgi:hypothetical protein
MPYSIRPLDPDTDLPHVDRRLGYRPEPGIFMLIREL